MTRFPHLFPKLVTTIGVVFRGFAGACARCGTQWDPRGCGSPPPNSGGRGGVPRRLSAQWWAQACCSAGRGAAVCAVGARRRAARGAAAGSRVAQNRLQSDAHGVTLLMWPSPVSRDNAGGCNVSIVSHPQIRSQRGTLSTASSSIHISTTANPNGMIQEPMSSY